MYIQMQNKRILCVLYPCLLCLRVTCTCWNRQQLPADIKPQEEVSSLCLYDHCKDMLSFVSFFLTNLPAAVTTGTVGTQKLLFFLPAAPHKKQLT